jgi:uncharacterized caspase-like protein
MLLRFMIAIVLLVLLPEASSAEKRVALIIGNGTYAKASQLPNPPRDAAAMGKLFREAGFDTVEVKTDLGAAPLRRALRDFSEKLQGADVAVLFYAGHGIEVSGTNYLIPTDAVLERDMDVEDEAVSLERIVQVMDQAKRLRLIILDACRDNPFVGSMKRTMASRSIGRGLAKVEVQSSDTLIAFAAKGGSTAADGEGSNSPYTSALVKHLTTPGLDLRLALGRVRDEVLKNTGNKQEPYVYGSLGGAEIALVPASATLAPQSSPATDNALTVPAASTSREFSKNSVTRFSWDSSPGEIHAGRRQMIRQANGGWIERYPNGNQDLFLYQGRTSQRNCEGILLERDSEPGFEIFVPDSTCPSMYVLWRRSKGAWAPLGQMKDVE